MNKKFIALAVAGVITAASFSALTGCSKNKRDFTWWLPAGDTAYYEDYQDNPVLDYIRKNVKFKNKNGEEQSISFKFEIPAGTSSAATDFNNMISKRDFTDIMDPSMYSDSLADLYERGAIIDLTPYAEDATKMPNLNRWLTNNPEYAQYCYTIMSDGSKKILAMPSISDQLDMEQQAFGFNYRRDLLVKYGKHPAQFFDPMVDEAPKANPKAGQNFSGSFTKNSDGSARNDTPSQNTTLPSGANGDSWVDDVTFPSGNKHPVYISDWQWMFEVFEQANLDYMLSIYNPGYNANGDLTSGFGGGGVYWYKDKNNEAKFGVTEQGFRAYLECMHNWYSEGWLDNNFNAKSDNFYSIDSPKIADGKVGLWMGNATRIGTRMSESAAGSIVYCCATPINDIPAYDGIPSTNAYSTQATAAQAKIAMEGGEGSKYMLQTPTCIFQNERIAGGAVITKNAADNKDLTLLLNFFDYLYSDEGSTLLTMGLSKEQQEQSGSSIYNRYGLSDGAYTTIGEGDNIKYQFIPKLEENTANIRSAMTNWRIPGIRALSKIQYSFPETYVENKMQWLKYEATGFIGGMLGNTLNPTEITTVGNVKLPLENDYLKKNVYKFIKGETSLNQTEWVRFCSGVANFTNQNTKVADATKAYNDAFARLYNKNN